MRQENSAPLRARYTAMFYDVKAAAMLMKNKNTPIHMT